MSGIFWILAFFSWAKAADDENAGILESCLLKVLENHFSNQPVLLITDLTTDREKFSGRLLPNLEREYHREIINKIMEKRRWTLQIYNTDRFMGLPSRLRFHKLKNSFFFTRGEVMASDELFEMEMDRLRKNPLWDPTGKNAVVVKAEGSRNRSDVLARKIIEKMWTESKAADNLVVIAREGGAVELYTWFPYRQPDCGRVNRVTHLDTFKDGRFLRENDLFPQKIAKDLQGCELVAATDTCIPYVFSEAENASAFVDGIEFRIVQSLSQQLNFKLRTVRPLNMWTTRVNKSVVGAFKLLVEQKIDLAFSCLMLDEERYLLALALPSYYEDSLCWFVPSPDGRTHVADIFHSFSFTLWLATFSAHAASIAVVVFLSYRDRGSRSWDLRVTLDCVLQMIGLSLSIPGNFGIKKLYSRVFFFVFCVYSIHVTIAFQSSLFALYRKPHYGRHYSSLKDAVDAGLFVYLRSSSVDLYNHSDHGLWEQILQPGRFGYLDDFGEAFSHIAYDKSAIALFIKTTGIYMISLYFTDDFGAPQVLWLNDKFSRYPVTMYMPLGHPLYYNFHKKIHALLSSGLIRLWLRRAVLGGKLRMELGEYANSPLSLTHLGGVFFLHLLLLGFALVVFLVEVAVYNLSKRNDLYKRKPERRHFFPPTNPKGINSNAVALVRMANKDQIFLT